MGQHGNEAVAIAGRAAAGARFAFAADPHPHFVVDACGNLDLSCDFLKNLTAAAAGRARMLDHRALAMALRAGCLDPHDAGGLNDAALTAAVAADFTPAALGGPRAFALLAVLVALELDGFRDTVGCLFERERHVAANASALASLIALAAAEQVAEQIAERREDIFDIGEMMGAELAVE